MIRYLLLTRTCNYYRDIIKLNDSQCFRVDIRFQSSFRDSSRSVAVVSDYVLLIGRSRFWYSYRENKVDYIHALGRKSSWEQTI